MMLFFFAALILCNVASGSDVVSLTESTFSELKKHDISLVKFYAPWCGHCKKLAPEFEKAASDLKTQKHPVFLAEVDCTVESTLCSGVSGYPTLKIYHNGENVEDYNGPRTADGIVHEMTSRSGPASAEFKTLEEMQNLTVSNMPVVVGQLKDENSYNIFLSCAKSLRSDMLFIHTYEKILDPSNETVLKLYFPNVLRSKLEGDSKVYYGKFKAADMKTWIKDVAYGSVGLRSQSTMKFYGKYPILVAYFKINTERDISGFNYWRNRILKVAMLFEKAMKFAVSDANSFGHELSELGFEDFGDRKTPVFAIISEKSQRYLMKDDFSIEALKKFVSDYMNGNVEPFIKSEPIPTEKDGHVTKVVAKNFEDVVMDESKDVLIEFYAPWCGHCKQLKPNYDALAEKLAGESEIVIAAMDATANTLLPLFPVTGFPTIFFVPKSSKEKPVLYEGGRETDDLLKFIAKSSTNELRGYDRSGKPKKTEL